MEPGGGLNALAPKFTRVRDINLERGKLCACLYRRPACELGLAADGADKRCRHDWRHGTPGAVRHVEGADFPPPRHPASRTTSGNAIS